MSCYSHVTRPNIYYISGCYSHGTRPCYSDVTRMVLAFLFGFMWKLLACYSPGFWAGGSCSFWQFLLNLLNGPRFSLKITFQSWKVDFDLLIWLHLARFLSDFFPFLVFSVFLVKFPSISCFSFLFCQIFAKNDETSKNQ